jgi:WD40 repeat protein
MIHQRRAQLYYILFIFISLLSACQQNSTITYIDTPIAKTPTSNYRRTPTATYLPSITPTRTSRPEPTPFATATITPTDRWDDRALELTPFPLTGNEISMQNVDEVRELAVWGTGRVNDLVLSPDALILAVGTNIGVYLYDSLNYELIALLPTRSPVQSITFSVENLWIALGEAGGFLEVFDYVELTPVVLLKPPQDEGTYPVEMALSFSNEGSQLTSVMTTPEKITVHRWHTSDWRTAAAFTVDRELISYNNSDINLLEVFSKDSLRLQSLSHPDEFQVVPLTTSVSGDFWTQTSTYEAQPAPSHDGDFILMNTGKSIVYWEIQDKRVSYRLDDYSSQLPSPCSTAPETCLNAQGEFSWDCTDTSNIPPIELIALTPDDVMVLISLNEGSSEFRRASDGMLAWEIEQNFTQVMFSPGSEFFFGLRPDGVIEKRGTLDGELINTLDRHPNRLYDLAFSPDGSVLAAGFSNGFVHIYNAYNGELLGVLTGSTRSLTFSPDGELLAGGLTDGTVRIYQLDAGRFYDIPPGHLAAVTDLVFSSNGEQLLTASEDCTFSLWNLRDRYRIENITPNVKAPFKINALEMLTDGAFKFISGDQAGLFVFDNTGSLETLKVSDSGFSDLALSPDGNFLGAAGEGGSLIADLRTTPYDITTLPFLEACAVSFTQDGSALALATRQGLEFWSVQDGSQLADCPLYEEDAPGELPAAMETAPDGSIIALGTQDGLIHIYGLP